MRFTIALLFCLFCCTSCHVGRFFIYNFADIKDYRKFPSHPVARDGVAFHFTPADNRRGDSSVVRLPREITIKDKPYSFEQYLERTKTVAFLVIRNDSLYYEKYFHKYNQNSIVPSFSAAKSFVSALVGIAIGEGYIKGVDQPITDYFPELDKAQFGKITIENLLDMQSGIAFNESYFNPFGDVAKYYYGTNLKKYVSHIKVKEPPGQHFEYTSLNTQLLGMIVSRATGKTLAAYLQEKIWQPLQMESDASWSIDSRKGQTEKAFCCLNAIARDYAKFGRLYLNGGSWNGRQVVPAEWVRRSVTFDRPKNGGIYSYQWWHNRGKEEQPPDFMAVGLLGQYTYVHPQSGLIIVRLGKQEGKHTDWKRMFLAIAEAQG
ncbi:serine hydrolase domain-containing protein [Taibaiella koreensis]|uniref:serine hydrolase domain-containing protein n=1 Tax=Taibaiella koreensis TaxID=1268548 RepID=UPI000E59D23B|nr:serine hydrolase [Taibaiella koreensis]